jgi:hypothetical protein
MGESQRPRRKLANSRTEWNGHATATTEISSVATKYITLIGECQAPLRLKCGQLGNTISITSRKAITRALVWNDLSPHRTEGTARKHVASTHTDNGVLEFNARPASNTANATAGNQSNMHNVHATLIAVRVELNCVTREV